MDKMKIIPYGRQDIDEADISEVVRVLRSEWVTQGPMIPAFEEKVAEACGARFGVSFSSGTAALHAACFAAGIGSGDEVIVPPLTFVATSNAVLYQGGKPVFSDIHPKTLNLDPDRIAEKITPRTKAILPVHFAGLPCEMEKIHAVAREKGILVIEDACHALGARWTPSGGKQVKVGSCSHSDMAVLSFHPVKHITTGEGGMVLTHREDLRDKLRSFRHHGVFRDAAATRDGAEPWRYEMRSLGYNYRITDIQCALGLSQMDKLERFIARREEIALRYRKACADLGLILQEPGGAGARHAWHLFVVQLPLERLPGGRGRVFETLRARGVGVNVHYLPVHLHPFYQERFGHRAGDFPVSERYYERALSIPLFPKMTDAEVETVIRELSSVLAEAGNRKAPKAAVAP